MSISHISNTNLSNAYRNMSSGKRINSAADDAAGLAQAERMEAQQRSMKAGANNVASAQDASKIQDGALGNITDSLQRMRELGVQAQNGLLSQSDRDAIQAEVNQLAQGIGDIAGQTNYNTKNLLDGTGGSMQISMGQGGDTELTTNDATLSGLGLTNLDVSSASFLDDIDGVLEKLDGMRASGGAQFNGFEHAYNNLNVGRTNTVASYSRKVDQDMGAGMTEIKKQQSLQQYQMKLKKNMMDNRASQAKALFS
ncbi:MAG: flagellin [Lachnospiraceae bacterium]|nr:flagellin [Lachnospiraceae bacterium]